MQATRCIPRARCSSAYVEADRAGLQIMIHAIGDRANDLILSIYEQVERENGKRDRRFRIEHAQHLRSQDIPRFARDRVIASMQPYHAIDDGRWAEKRIGKERAKTTYAFRSLLDAGVTLAFGTDWTVAPLNPMLTIYAAVTRRTHRRQEPERLGAGTEDLGRGNCACLHRRFGLRGVSGRREGKYHALASSRISCCSRATSSRSIRRRSRT